MDSKEQLEKVYKDHHLSSGRYGYLFCHGKRVPYLKKWIGAEKRVLDIGCRDGELTQHFAMNNTVTGVDIDRDALDVVKKRLGIETLWLDVNSEWPFHKMSYDVVLACEILEHVFYFKDFLINISETLKKGGIFIGSVPNAFRMRNRMKFLFGKEFETDPTHVNIFSYACLKEILLEHFSEVKIVPIQGKILPFLPVNDKLPHRLCQIFSKDLLWKAVK